jgi:hypothetical protein
MSTESDDTQKRGGFTDDEVKLLIGQIAEAVRRGTQGKRSFADVFWERMASVSTFVGSVVLGAVALMFNANYNAQQAKQSEAQFDFEQHKFIHEQEGQRRQTLKDIIPNLFSESAPEREGAQALLLEIYPNEAKEILEHVARLRPAPQQETIAQVIRQADTISKEVGTWGVVIGHDDSADAAAAEVNHAKEVGFAAAVYKKRSWFITVAQGRIGQEQGGFANEDDANRANFEISRAIREGTYVVPLKKWCQNPQPQQGYVQCSNE